MFLLSAAAFVSGVSYVSSCQYRFQEPLLSKPFKSERTLSASFVVKKFRSRLGFAFEHQDDEGLIGAIFKHVALYISSLMCYVLLLVRRIVLLRMP
jgi:hypothetical protein